MKNKKYILIAVIFLLIGTFSTYIYMKQVSYARERQWDAVRNTWAQINDIDSRLLQECPKPEYDLKLMQEKVYLLDQLQKIII
jgi:predicted small secreted protein